MFGSSRFIVCTKLTLIFFIQMHYNAQADEDIKIHLKLK
uniref:Uncharacterized protein n=1 Tax=Rhizophora mucronata TaxID=61149 RepID=A0A2P2PRU3_RHIMU